MSSTMQAWRTALNVPKNQTYNAVTSVLDSITDYWYNTSTASSQKDYYVSDNFFLRANTNGMAIYKTNVFGTSNLTFGNYNNMTVYKSGKCIIICVNCTSATTSEYSAKATYIIDKTDNNTGNSIIHMVSNSISSDVGDSYCKLFDDSNTVEMTVYSPYNGTYSLQPNTTTLAQIAPFCNSSLGKKFDNLHGVLSTPYMNKFVDISGTKWLFTNGFALSAGGEVPTPTVVS